MSLSHEHVGPKILGKIKIYVLVRAELLFPLCYEIPCRSLRRIKERIGKREHLPVGELLVMWCGLGVSGAFYTSYLLTLSGVRYKFYLHTCSFMIPALSLFLAVNHHNIENWVPFILTHNWWLFMGIFLETEFFNIAKSWAISAKILWIDAWVRSYWCPSHQSILLTQGPI